MTLERNLYGPDHEAFRETVRTFLTKEVAPHHERWEKNGVVDRQVWRSAGRQGLLGMAVGEEYGGGGTGDFRYSAVLIEEFARAGVSGLALSLHNDIVGPYLTRLADEEQKRRWLPGFTSGDIVTAIAMTEPGAGSDLQGIRTTATDQGDHYLLNGAKTFISNGILADLVVVVARTTPEGGSGGQSLLVVERGTEASNAAATSTRSARRPRTPPSCSSTTCASPRRTCWARRTGRSPTSWATSPRSGWPSRSGPPPRPRRSWTSPRGT